LLYVVETPGFATAPMAEGKDAIDCCRQRVLREREEK